MTHMSFRYLYNPEHFTLPDDLRALADEIYHAQKDGRRIDVPVPSRNMRVVAKVSRKYLMAYPADQLAYLFGGGDAV